MTIKELIEKLEKNQGSSEKTEALKKFLERISKKAEEAKKQSDND